MMKTLLMFVVFTFSFITNSVFSKNNSVTDLTDTVNGLEKEKTYTIEPYEKNENVLDYFLSKDELILAIPILFVLVLIFILEIWLVKSRVFSEEATIKLIVVTLVVISCLFVMIAGFDDKQLAPIFGLFGTICGYLFGRDKANKNTTN